MSDKLNNLPPSSDKDFWQDAEAIQSKPVALAMCSTHTKDNWLTHFGYIDNHDGTISCKYCPWGTPLSGRYRVFMERIVDLKTFARG